MAVALVTLPACGARWTNAQDAEFVGRGQARVAAASPTVTTLSPVTEDRTIGPITAPTPAGIARSGTPTPVAAASLPCAAPSTANGVTDDTITIGTIASLTGPVPGLGASAVAAVRAYVEYRNATGGVCGRRVVLKRADDGTDTGRYRAAVLDLDPDVFGLTGGFSVGDSGGVDVVRATKIPVVNVPTSHFLAELPNVFDIDPNFAGGLVAGKYKYLVAHGAKRAYVAYIAIDQSRYESSEHIRLMKAAGMNVVGVSEIPLATLSFDSLARDVANANADYLYFIGDTRANIAITNAIDDSGYDLKFIDFLAYAYNDQFIAQTGAAGHGAMVWLRTAAIEDASANPAMATLVKWMERTAPGEPKDDLAIHSWIGVKTFLEQLENLPGPISREAFVARLRSVGAYDADGLLQPIELGTKVSHGCMVGLHVEGGRWRRLAPTSGFLC